MRNRLGFTVALAAILVAFALPTVAAAGEKWTVLGERRVTDRADLDSIPVSVRRGDFEAIKLVVRGQAVQFREVTVHFAQGAPQKVELRDVIPAGGESRAIDLVGGDRVIRSVELRYDAQSFRGKAARVVVYGRR